MGYRKTTNLYRRPEFLDMFKRVYVTEKVHGSSCSLTFTPEGLRIFSGGCKHEEFVKLFDQEKLLKIYDASSFAGKKLVIYGEGYGPLHKMSHTYGKDLGFIVFEVCLDDKYWFNVPDAEGVAKKFKLEFVWYKLVDNTLENLNKYRDQPSELAKVKGCGDDKQAEGIVVRPLWECYDAQDGRWIVKHKHDRFGETKTPREVDPNKALEKFRGQAAADELCTPMRLEHILDKHPEFNELKNIPDLIKVMLDDIRTECSGEFEESKNFERAVGGKTVALFKEFLNQKLLERVGE